MSEDGMFHQLLTPIGDSLGLSFLVASIPIIVVLVMLGVLQRPAWQASLAGLISALIVAVTAWKMPVGLALNSTAAGITFALWPIMWIVLAALTLYNIALQSGRFDAFRRWVLESLPNDRRIVLIVIGYGFGSLLEGVAGFGAPVAITASLLILLGFKSLDAVVYALIFNTAPVAFGSLGVPITTLAGVTGHDAHVLGAMVGRQLPFFALLLPFYVMAMFGGMKSVRELFPVLLVSGGAFALGQFISSNYLTYELTDVISAGSALIATVLFLKVWKPAPNAEFALIRPTEDPNAPHAHVKPWQGWMPWIIMCVLVMFWTELKIASIWQQNIAWPGLHNVVFRTVYQDTYTAIWNWQPFATGTAILVTALITTFAVGQNLSGFAKAFGVALRHVMLPGLTVCAIVGLAYLMNYSGLTYTLGMGVAASGALFPLLSAFLGWLAVFLSGSDSSGNALFGNLQVVAARQLNFDPVLMAATNSSGGVFAKMISPQNIAIGVAVSDLKGHESVIFRRTFIHSIIFTVILGIMVFLQQHVLTWMIPSY
ncbi:MAG: L-lactate permease [Nevskiaceae bacterium]|jgi:lactate permease|nr:L-lactate permease [Nevskiaceae bacterium]